MANSHSVLIADDDRAIRTVLSQALGRAGYAVRATSSASTLWRWAAQDAWRFVTLPEDLSETIRLTSGPPKGFGSIR